MKCLSSVEKFSNLIINSNIIFPGVVDRDLVSLIKGLLNRNPSMRFGFEDVMKHPLLANFDIGKLMRQEYKPSFVPNSKSADSLEQEMQKISRSESYSSQVSRLDPWVKNFAYDSEEFTHGNQISSSSSATQISDIMYSKT